MTVTLVTVPNVPIVSTGEYQLASGTTTFSAEDLADAVKAAGDPTVPRPRLKLGHTDPRFDEAVASGELDGEPAFGTVQNLRLSADGQTVLGDYCDVPEWLAEMLPSSYPGRSIEGGFGYTAPSGRSYRLVIARVALLGITWPGVTSLADLREVLEQNGEADAELEPVLAASDSQVNARITRPGDGQPPSRSAVLAGMDIGNVRMQFVGDLDTGEVPQVPHDQPQADDVGPQVWWWPRSVRVEDDGSLCLIVDDDNGRLIRIPFTVNQGDLIYGQPELVIETYVPVTSDPDDSGQVTARGQSIGFWPVRAASRPSTTQEASKMDIDAAVLRKRLGLAEDADEAAITQALDTEPEQVTASVDKPEVKIPEGMALVDEATLTQLRSGAEQAEKIAARMARDDRDKVIASAIDAGKFPAARREHYEKMWNADETGTRELLASMAAGMIPVGRREIGSLGDGENQPQAVEAEHQAFMAAHFPNETRRLASRENGRVRVRQEA